MFNLSPDDIKSDMTYFFLLIIFLVKNAFCNTKSDTTH